MVVYQIVGKGDDEGVDFHVWKDDHVSLLDIAKAVWPEKKNYYNVVRKKAIDQAYQDKDLHRVGMMSDSVFVDVTKLRAILTRLCHREKAAKEQLLKFDFSFIPKALVGLHKKLSAQKIAETEALLADLKLEESLIMEKYSSLVV